MNELRFERMTDWQRLINEDLPAPGPAICPSCGWSGEETTCPDCGRPAEPNQDKGATYE